MSELPRQGSITQQLLSLSHQLGTASESWAILGEGNSSARLDGEAFLVKASGSQLASLTEQQLVAMRFAPLLDVLASSDALSDDSTRQLLLDSRISEEAAMPSVETLFHADLLSLQGIDYVGHTHVVSINSLLCSEDGWKLMQRGGRLFPDEIVVCGIAPCCVPYTDPGIPLARAIRAEVQGFVAQHGVRPKTIYLQNHGFIALGGSASEVLNITRMADKAANIMLGAIGCGGPNFMSEADVLRIADRPDEHLRQRALGLTQSSGKG